MTAITAHSRQKRSRRKSVALFRLNTPHTARNAAGWQAKQRKSAAFIEKLHIGAAPFALMGFVKYNGMNAEQFVWAWIKSEFLMPKKLMFQPDNLYYETLKAAIQNHEKEALKNNA